MNGINFLFRASRVTKLKIARIYQQSVHECVSQFVCSAFWFMWDAFASNCHHLNDDTVRNTHLQQSHRINQTISTACMQNSHFPSANPPFKFKLIAHVPCGKFIIIFIHTATYSCEYGISYPVKIVCMPLTLFVKQQTWARWRCADDDQWTGMRSWYLQFASAHVCWIRLFAFLISI